MTFEWPLGLLALAIVPLVLGLLWLSRRRQSRYAVRFSNVDVLAAVAQATSSPWRFVPPALLCAALAALAVGLARPQVSVSAERKQGTVVLALDRSGSMLAQDVDPDRITASRRAALSFVKSLPSGFAVGVVTFSDSADAVSAPSRDKSGAERAIAGIRAGGGTAIGDALERSLGLLGVTSATTAKSGAGKGRAILLLSDGSNTQGVDPSAATAAAKRAGVPIYTIAFGTPDGVLDLQQLGIGVGTIPVPPDPEALRAIARDTGGESFTAGDASTLKRVYSKIGTRVSATNQKKEVTFIVAGAAAALLLAAAASSWALRITT
jgi:Ca-activated chloride channel homolog